MTTVTWREARENFADLINRVRYQNARIAITRHGKVVAELIPSQHAQSRAGEPGASGDAMSFRESSFGQLQNIGNNRVAAK